MYMIFVIIVILLVILFICKINVSYITNDTPITFYHPIIKKQYCKLIILKKLKNINIDHIENKLLQTNNNLLINNPYINMDERANTIKNNAELQTIFNLIYNIDKLN